MDWIIINEDYLNYLRGFESRIPNSDYGTNHYKPFFGRLFSNNGFTYVSQISHKQPRHESLKNSLDFQKIYIPSKNKGQPDQFVAVVNLNYMFPIKDEMFKTLQYSKIDEVRSFSSELEKSQYIDLLQQELIAINKLKLDEKALKLYHLKYDFPEDPISRRSLDFKNLEKFASKYV